MIYFKNHKVLIFYSVKSSAWIAVIQYLDKLYLYIYYIYIFPIWFTSNDPLFTLITILLCYLSTILIISLWSHVLEPNLFIFLSRLTYDALNYLSFSP